MGVSLLNLAGLEVIKDLVRQTKIPSKSGQSILSPRNSPFKSSWRNKAREHVKKNHGQNIDFSMAEFITEIYTKKSKAYPTDLMEGLTDQEEPQQHHEIKQEVDIFEDIKTII